MNYRSLSKKIEFKPSALGFGLMRLPLKEDNTPDVEEAVKMVRYAVDNGVNYLDTAYMYHGGESEKIMANVLKDGYRKKVRIADKMPLWMVKEESDLDKIFFDQMKKLEVDKIDFYLLHALSKESIPLFKRFNLIDWMKKKKNDGLIDYMGFSFHDKYPIFKKIIDLTDWDVCLMQFNIIDIKHQAGLKGLEYAHDRGVGIIVMEALRGGQLTMSVPHDIKKMWANMAKLCDMKEYNPAQFMLNYVWNYYQVGCVISGMSNMEQVKQNLEYAKNSVPDSITEPLHRLYKDIRKAYLDKIVINCTKCDYCKICPQKIAIPYIFDQTNEISRYQSSRTPMFRYNFLEESQRANKCTNCRKCVSMCPQKLDIPELIRKCSMVFDEKNEFGKIFS